jgi:hypothetical protein
LGWSKGGPQGGDSGVAVFACPLGGSWLRCMCALCVRQGLLGAVRAICKLQQRGSSIAAGCFHVWFGCGGPSGCVSFASEGAVGRMPTVWCMAAGRQGRGAGGRRQQEEFVGLALMVSPDWDAWGRCWQAVKQSADGVLTHPCVSHIPTHVLCNTRAGKLGGKHVKAASVARVAGQWETVAAAAV